MIFSFIFNSNDICLGIGVKTVIYLQIWTPTMAASTPLVQANEQFLSIDTWPALLCCNLIRLYFRLFTFFICKYTHVVQLQ